MLDFESCNFVWSDLRLMQVVSCEYILLKVKLMEPDVATPKTILSPQPILHLLISTLIGRAICFILSENVIFGCKFGNLFDGIIFNDEYEFGSDFDCCSSMQLTLNTILSSMQYCTLNCTHTGISLIGIGTRVATVTTIDNENIFDFSISNYNNNCFELPGISSLGFQSDIDCHANGFVCDLNCINYFLFVFVFTCLSREEERMISNFYY